MGANSSTSPLAWGIVPAPLRRGGVALPITGMETQIQTPLETAQDNTSAFKKTLEAATCMMDFKGNSVAAGSHGESENDRDPPYSQCMICLEDFIDGDKLRLLPCLHRYHIDCVDQWLQKFRLECPLCRYKIA